MGQLDRQPKGCSIVEEALQLLLKLEMQREQLDSDEIQGAIPPYKALEIRWAIDATTADLEAWMGIARHKRDHADKAAVRSSRF